MCKLDTKKLILRPISEEDLPFLRKVYDSTRVYEQKKLGWVDEEWDFFMDRQFNAQHDYYHIHYSDSHFCIIIYENTLIGRLYVERLKEEIRIMDIALLPDYCNKGLGTYLLKNIMDEAEKDNKYIRLHIDDYNPAVSLFLRLGFYQIRKKGQYILFGWQSESYHSNCNSHHNC